MKKVRLAAAILAALLCTGCGGGLRAYLTDGDVSPAGDKTASQAAVDAETMCRRQEEFSAFLESVREKRRGIYNGQELDFPEQWAGSPIDSFTEEELTALAQKPADILPELTAREAAEDIETLFRLLR